MANEKESAENMDHQGLKIKITVPSGGIRKGKGPNNTTWEQTVSANYGYILNTKSIDGKNLNCWVRLNPKPNAKVYVIHQMSLDGAKFDEDKVMLGFSSPTDAEKMFKKHALLPDVQFGGISDFDVDHFKVIAFSGRNSKVMLSNDKNFQKFKSKGYLPRGVKSPVEVAMKVKEDLHQTLSSIANEMLTEYGLK